MSRFDASAAMRASLWEQVNRMTTNASERIDRLLLGDEAYDYSQEVAAEVRQAEHQIELEKYRAAVRISEANRRKRGR